MGRKNLLIICCDEMRGDCAGFMGNPDIRTPNFDRLAGRGVVFENHMTNFPKCLPARASLMTGRYGNTHGWRTVQQVMDPQQRNLLRTLADDGYETAVFGKNHCWHDTDWSRLDYRSDSPSMLRFLEGRPSRQHNDPDPDGVQPLELHEGWDYCGCSTRHRPDEGFAEQTVDFLEHTRDPGRPFFLQLNFESPHPVYGVEEPWFSMYDRDAIRPFEHRLPENAPLVLREERKWRTGVEPDERAAVEIQATYYGMISKVDHLAGQVIDALDRQDLWKDTVVLFWADHGDYAGQFCLPEKYDTSFHDCLLRTPCVLCDPSLEPGRYDGLTDHADIAPTLIGLLGCEPLPGMRGHDMLPMLRGEYRRAAVFADGGHEQEMLDRFRSFGRPEGRRRGKSEVYYQCPDTMARAKMVRTEKHKLVISLSGSNELYDLEADPNEMNNRWGDPELASVVPGLMQLIVEWDLQTDPQDPWMEWFTV